MTVAGYGEKDATARVTARAQNPKTLLDDGPATAEERNNLDIIKDNKGGTSADYLTARIARDRPDILARGAIRLAAGVATAFLWPGCPFIRPKRA